MDARVKPAHDGADHALRLPRPYRRSTAGSNAGPDVLLVPHIARSPAERAPDDFRAALVALG